MFLGSTDLMRDAHGIASLVWSRIHDHWISGKRMLLNLWIVWIWKFVSVGEDGGSSGVCAVCESVCGGRDGGAHGISLLRGHGAQRSDLRRCSRLEVPQRSRRFEEALCRSLSLFLSIYSPCVLFLFSVSVLLSSLILSGRGWQHGMRGGSWRKSTLHCWKGSSRSTSDSSGFRFLSLSSLLSISLSLQRVVMAWLITDG